MLPYFEYRERDKLYYQEHISHRIPEQIFDIHVHINLSDHVKMVPEERWFSDWALECGHVLPVEDAYAIARELFPDVKYKIAGFPWPIREADLRGNNSYLSKMHRQNKLAPFMVVMPDWEIDEIERTLIEDEFYGFKPYPDMVSGVKGADISIFDYLPHTQLEILNKYKKVLMLHLPRQERLADDVNIRELLDIRQKYPDVKIIIAHFGRCFCPYYLETGLKKFGDAQGFYFDTSDVINPELYDVAFSRIPPEVILYGSDMPITLWHEKREWTEKSYINLCRENFSWNKNRKTPEEEEKYTIFLYEEFRAILDAIDRHGFSKDQKQGIFSENARLVLGISA